ncbi:MAG: choice-of-anchor B family protein [Planctomycetota bacterium]
MRTLSALALLACALPAQIRNAQLLGSFNPGHSSNDIWGYRDPTTGKEYALFLTTRGTYVMDCTTGTPIQRGFFSGPNSSWRDAKTWGQYAYIVTEGGGGMQILDLGTPDTPALIGTWGSSFWGNAHNICIDEGVGIAYVCGTNVGTVIIDLRQNPTNPTRIGTFGSPYIHDLQVQNGYAHMCDIYGNNYLIGNVSNPATITVVGQIRAPGTRYFHNVWATRDDNYAAGTNETSGGPVSIYDIRNKSLPLQIATIHPAPSTAIVHNTHMRDRVCHISYYTEGYVGIDLSSPANPVVVGQYDTYPGASSSYHGAWGCYPFQPSGIVYISDIETGLYVIRPTASVARYGTDTAGGSGARPKIYGFGSAYLGNANFGLEVEAAPASAPGVLLLNSGRANVNVAGLQLNVDPFGGVPVLVAINTDAAGKASLPLPVPNLSHLDGSTLNAQAFVYDVGGPLNMGASQGLEFNLFVR